MKQRILILACGLIILLQLAFRKKEAGSVFQFHQQLSGYGFFTGPLHKLQPAEGVVPYSLNTPLFSNYAEKLRFIKMPTGSKAIYNPDSVFTFPLGTILIKNFYFPVDFRKPEKGRRIIETRLLALREDGWATYQYIWNAEQTDAEFEPIGDEVTVSYTDARGKKITTPYLVPNQNQCKGCHAQGNRLLPIGPAARHLNGNYTFADKTANQLAYWKEKGMIDLPEGPVPANAVWGDKAAPVADRARAYLDINCGFCHSAKGPANTSGLFLDIHNNNSTALGIRKTPVAAGRGAGNLQFDIVPGHPEKSILIYRMTSTDPGIAMPEIGREQLHKEGVALISEWIKTMSDDQ